MVYLNNAATTYPKPREVVEAYERALLEAPASQFRSADSLGREDIFEACRESLGRLFGVEESGRIFFSSGATDSANRLLYGLELEGRKIVTTVTEHNSILRPLFNMKRFQEVRLVGCDREGRVDPDDVKAQITPGTGAVIVNHCSNVTGMVQDLSAIGRIAKEAGALLIADVSQSAGAIPIHAKEDHVDALIFTGHKGLYGVQGTGGYYVRRDVPFRPVFFGGTGRDSSRLVYDAQSYEYEVGTQNGPGIAALYAGVNYVLKKGPERIQLKERKLMKLLYDGLEEIPRVTVYGKAKKNEGPVLSFCLDGLSASDVAYILKNAYDITVRTGLHCAPLIHKELGTGAGGTVRVSVSDFTTERDVESLLLAVREIAGAGTAV